MTLSLQYDIAHPHLDNRCRVLFPVLTTASSSRRPPIPENHYQPMDSQQKPQISTVSPIRHEQEVEVSLKQLIYQQPVCQTI